MNQTQQTKHTPGPWTRLEMSNDATATREQLVSNGRAAIQLIHDGSPEANANANLIAAAPDLLEACKAAYDALVIQCPRLDARDQIVAAIAKAEGR